VLLPSGADQFDNAGAFSRAGAAIGLRPPAASADAVRSSLSAVLGEPASADAAKRLAAEIDAMLTPAEAAAILS